MVGEKGVCQLASTSRGTLLCDAPESTREANLSSNCKEKFGLLSEKHLKNRRNTAFLPGCSTQLPSQQCQNQVCDLTPQLMTTLHS